jgi:cytoskeletal protein CcmA (bactofilin family)
MWWRNKTPTIEEGVINTFLGPESEFNGDIVVKGTIRIDGKVYGNIVSQDGVIIGEGGLVQGNIEAVTVVSSGIVQGNIQAEKKLELLKGQVAGDISTALLAISEGVVFEGKCVMKKHETVIPKEEPKKEFAY